MNSYKVLRNQVFRLGDYTLLPIRFEDRYDIMNWRNEQIYHLRQSEPLTKEVQSRYFAEVVQNLFDQPKPEQILFSFLEKERCIGYGGLVHINWIDQNAEISFIMNTALEKNHFEKNWSEYLKLIEEVAFSELGFHKLYVYAFDLRPHLYTTLEANGYVQDARLKGHCKIDQAFKDVVIHAKWKDQ